jgi:peptide-methionine (R)-S-oxide reductase
MDDQDLKKKLSPEAYRILREKGTEAPFSGKYLHNNSNGVYSCLVCGSKLFSSKNKYDSVTPGLIGWPSFNDAIDNKSIDLQDDTSLGMKRIEVVCKKCGSHLGHLFDDSSIPGGKHYCINSGALDFEQSK